MSNCEKCRCRATYDKDPRSILAEFGNGILAGGPGWKSYLKSLPEEDRKQLKTILEEECKFEIDE